MSKKLLRKLVRAKKIKPFKNLDSSALLMTMTNEFFQPARIYYDVYDQVALQNIFLDLECMDYDDQKKRWVWNYTDEAKKIQFKRSWSEIPKESHPLVIGSLYAPKESQLYIDVNSFERVPAAIRFFGDRINQKIAEVTHMQLYNKISRIRDGIPDHHKLFEKILSHRPDPDAEIHAFIAEAKKSGNLEKSKHKLDTIETMKIYYDIGYEEDCLETLLIGLRMRTAIAIEHDRGNTDFTFSDFFNKVLNLSEK
jgi:hypothetical protein